MKAITANRLSDGRVVYRCASGAWTETLDEATLFDDAAAEDALAETAFEHLQVVGPYLIEVEERVPAGREEVRERIRLKGPSAGSLHTGLAEAKRAGA
jgi:hypothetical protein